MASNSSSDNWEMEKKKLANLPLAERRKNYFCRDKYVPVSQVPTWRDYFNEQQKSLTEKGIFLIFKLYFPQIFLMFFAVFTNNKFSHPTFFDVTIFVHKKNPKMTRLIFTFI
jgi:hypothetical protein